MPGQRGLIRSCRQCRFCRQCIKYLCIKKDKGCSKASAPLSLFPVLTNCPRRPAVQPSGSAARRSGILRADAGTSSLAVRNTPGRCRNQRPGGPEYSGQMPEPAAWPSGNTPGRCRNQRPGSPEGVGISVTVLLSDNMYNAYPPGSVSPEPRDIFRPLLCSLPDHDPCNFRTRLPLHRGFLP